MYISYHCMQCRAEIKFRIVGAEKYQWEGGYDNATHYYKSHSRTGDRYVVVEGYCPNASKWWIINQLFPHDEFQESEPFLVTVDEKLLPMDWNPNAVPRGVEIKHHHGN